MQSKYGKVIVVGLVLLTLLSDAQAQRRRRPGQVGRDIRPAVMAPTIGIRLGNDFKNDNYLLGGQLWLPIGHFWKLAPSFDYFFVDNVTRWQFNGDFLFKPRPRGFFYLGGGLAVDYSIPEGSEKNSTLGGNALAGLDFGGARLKSLSPYIQARWTFFDQVNYFSLIGGINLILR